MHHCWIGVVSRSHIAIGVVKTGEVYQAEMSADFKPFRVDVRYLKCQQAPIRPLIEQLTFIKSKTHWGAAFRFGQMKVPEADFMLIAAAMNAAAALNRLSAQS
jgi:predicted RNA-binding protein